MNLIYKVIFLYFKKGLTMIEIAEVLNIDLSKHLLASNMDIPSAWLVDDPSPLEIVHKIIGNEVAQHYLLGEYSKFVDYNKSVLVFRNQHPERGKYNKKVI